MKRKGCLIWQKLIVAWLFWPAAVSMTWAQFQLESAVVQPPLSTLAAPADEVRTAEVSARILAWAPQGVAVGKPLWLGLYLQHAPGWHTYWKNPGQAGAATVMQWQMPGGLSAGTIRWPTPVKIPVGSLINYGYDGDVLLTVPVLVQKVPDTADITITLHAQWLACKVQCLPQQGTLRLQLPVATPITDAARLFEKTAANIPVSKSSIALFAEVQAANNSVIFHVTGLPSAWQGRSLNVYPETTGVFVPQITTDQYWNGNTWRVTLPLDARRTVNPETLSLVVALQDTVSIRQPILRNAAGQAAYYMETKVQGRWSDVMEQAAIPAALASALSSDTSVSDTAMAKGQGAEGAIPAVTMLSATMLWAMAAALLGGLLLNLMPCVFPVLGIKVLSFARHAHHPRELRLSGVAYGVGCISSFLLLAAGLLALRATGEQLGWGFQLQNPYVVAVLAVLFTLLALNFLGLFNVGQWLPSSWQPAAGEQRALILEAFLSGILAVFIASPCSAPFVGAALGLALGLPPLQALAVFACLGLGLALPVLFTTFFPHTLAWLPKPGPWMQKLRRWMAVPMLATVVWLAWVLKQQSGTSGMMALTGLLILLAGWVGAWQFQGKVRWLIAACLSLALLGWGALYGKQLSAIPSSQPQTLEGIWQPWTPARVQSALQSGRPVMVDYTAAWCVTCQFNKMTVLDQPAFLQLAHRHRAVLLRADWTRYDPAITESLRNLGRAAVPTYAIYHPATIEKPLILTELLTLEKINQALQSKQ